METLHERGAIALASPIKPPSIDILSIYYSSQIAENAKAIPRHNLSLPDGKKTIGNLTWYKQVGDTCGVYSVVNAQLSLGMIPSWENVKQYHNESTGYPSIENAIVDQSIPFDIVLSTDNIRGAANPKIYGKPMSSGEFTLTEADVQHNASLIKSLIDRNIVPLCSVDGDKLFLALGSSILSQEASYNPQHALPVVGYEIRDGKMDILLLESNYGPLRLPIEYFSQIALAHSETYLGYVQSKQP